MGEMSVTLEIWGDFALWTRPESKVERLTYPFPTPSGIRGVLSSIYAKPNEFLWSVRRIEVLRPIRYITFKRNEVKAKMPRLPKAAPEKVCIDYEAQRTQRQSVCLKDVRYRITADILPRPDFSGSPAALYNQAERRIQRGQAFLQPCMGVREFPAYFEWGSSGMPPIAESLELGLMLYDVFDLHNWQKTEPERSLFCARMENGVIEVPPFDSPLVLRAGAEEEALC